MAAVPDIRLNNGVTIPQVGFGVFQIPPDQVVEPVKQAVAAGYRLIDTAAAYRNERGVGQAIAECGVPREELSVTTKLWNSDQGYDNALRAFDGTLRRLGLDAVDLYLIHWPVPGRDLYVDTWRAFERIHKEGRARAIGVSNFTVAQLSRLMDETDVVPAVNQIELHPQFPQEELRRFHAGAGITTEAWGPIGQGKGLLDEPVVGDLAAEAGRSPAQVILRWHIQLGNVVIPKSVHAERIRQNIELFDFELTGDQLARLATLDRGRRLGPDPDTFNMA